VLYIRQLFIYILYTAYTWDTLMFKW